MKKLLSFLCCFTLLLSLATPAYAKQENVLNIRRDAKKYAVSPLLYGAGLDDSAFACDGGLVSNLIQNGSFEYTEKPDMAWIFKNVNPVLSGDKPIHIKNPTFQTFTLEGRGIIENLGFSEIYADNTHDYDEKKAGRGGMGFQEGMAYDFSCYLRNIDFEGDISVYLQSKNNNATKYQLPIHNITKNNWTKVTTTLTAAATETGSLAIVFDGKGSIAFDFATLTPQNSYGYGNPQWQYTTLRSDVWEALKTLSPACLRFPDGCLTEGADLTQLYNWKDTVGPPEERKQTRHIWAEETQGRYQLNTNAMGYHEYFQLCEDLGAVAIPTVHAGITCQMYNDYDAHRLAFKKLSMTDEEWKHYLITEHGFKEKDEKGMAQYTQQIEALGINSQTDWENWMNAVALQPDTDAFTNYAQDILDLIEYANGDAQTTYWGALRAANGHPQPFKIQYLAIGNEYSGDIYMRNVRALQKIIHQKYPKLRLIVSAGKRTSETAFEEAEETVRQNFSDALIAEQYISDTFPLSSFAAGYDSYDRDGNSVIISRYAADNKKSGSGIRQNTFAAAIEEAAFLTGLERNADLVKTACYAPALAKVNAQTQDAGLIWFDAQQTACTPGYYVQLLFSHNVGTQYVQTSFSQEQAKGLYHSVTVDENRQMLYIKLVNTQKKQRFRITTDGFAPINAASQQTLTASPADFNKIHKQYVAPQETALSVTEDALEISLEKNSITVVRIAYGNATDASFYTLPETLDMTTRKKLPKTTAFLLLLPLLFFFIVKKGYNKSKKDRQDI